MAGRLAHPARHFLIGYEMKKIWMLLCIFLMSCGNTASSDTGYLVLTGRIDDKMVSGVSKNIHRVHSIIITSQGGDASSAMDLARMIYDNKIYVRVEKYCLSACAQYIIPAASVVEFVGKPVLGVHQSPTSVRDFFKIQNIEIGSEHHTLAKKEEDFFRYISLNNEISTEPVHYLDIVCYGEKNGNPAIGSKWGFFVPTPQTYKRWIGKNYTGNFAYSKQNIIESFNAYLPKNTSMTFILEYEATRREFNKVTECQNVK
jgi:hypothetical protein